MKTNEIRPHSRPVLITALLIAVLPFFSCNTMAHFDAWSYKETISAKVEALDLMDMAVDSFHQHEEEVRETMLQMRTVYEYEKNRPKNFETAKMWELLLAEDKKLYGAFIERWREKGVHNKVFIEEKMNQIEEAFDIIIDLENKKIKKSEVETFIGNNN